MNYFESSNELFHERYSEVSNFLKVATTWKDDATYHLSREHEHILKSNIILMQYNVIEAVFLELFSRLYERLSNYNALIDDMNKDLIYQLFCMIRRLSSSSHEKFKDLITQTTPTTFSSIILTLCFELTDETKKNLVNGNLDGKKIKEFFKNFGIDTTLLDSMDLKNIYEIKNQRQLLAHGGLSFSGVGKDVSWDTLKENNIVIKQLFEQSKSILTEFINNLQNSSNVEESSSQ